MSAGAQIDGDLHEIPCRYWTTRPANQTIVSGTAATLSVTASATAPSYQWYIGPSGTTANRSVGRREAVIRHRR
jgi:hypothetical protein